MKKLLGILAFLNAMFCVKLMTKVDDCQWLFTQIINIDKKDKIKSDFVLSSFFIDKYESTSVFSPLSIEFNVQLEAYCGKYGKKHIEEADKFLLKQNTEGSILDKQVCSKFLRVYENPYNSEGSTCKTPEIFSKKYKKNEEPPTSEIEPSSCLKKKSFLDYILETHKKRVTNKTKELLETVLCEEDLKSVPKVFTSTFYFEDVWETKIYKKNTKYTKTDISNDSCVYSFKMNAEISYKTLEDVPQSPSSFNLIAIPLINSKTYEDNRFLFYLTPKSDETKIKTLWADFESFSSRNIPKLLETMNTRMGPVSIPKIDKLYFEFDLSTFLSEYFSGERDTDYSTKILTTFKLDEGGVSTAIDNVSTFCPKMSHCPLSYYKNKPCILFVYDKKINRITTFAKDYGTFN